MENFSVFYTAAQLFSFGLDYGVSCFCRLTPETPAACSECLSWLQSLMFCSSSYCPTLCCQHLLFDFDPDELRTIPNVFVYMLNVSKYFIWHTRNDFRFQEVQPGAIVAIEGVKSRVRLHLLLFFKRFKSLRRRRYFGCQWGACGIIASVVDGRLTIHL